jgi:hypothetical protein
MTVGKGRREVDKPGDVSLVTQNRGVLTAGDEAWGEVAILPFLCILED